MGSSYFYMEFLIGLVHLIRTSSKAGQFQNPALFALEYTLVPDATFPHQLHQTLAGYEHVLSILSDPARICLMGDSAGATLILSLLLHLAHKPRIRLESVRPGFAVLISPWVTLISPNNHNTPSDYIDADHLHRYARQYVGSKFSLLDPIVSPGMCKDEEWWRRAAPSRGMAITIGSEEVLAPETRELVRLLQRANADVMVEEAEGSIHAWPVAALFLSDTGENRLKGLRRIVAMIGERLG